MHFFQTPAGGRFVKEQTKRKRNEFKKSKRSAKTVSGNTGRVFTFSRHRKSATRQNSLSPFACVSNIPPPQREKMSASPASYNVTLATLRTTSPPSRNKTRKQVRQQTEKEKRRARLLKKLEIVALRERGFAAHNVRFFTPLHYPLFLI